MSERIRKIEASLSPEEAERVRVLLASRRPVSEIQDELGRLFAPRASGAPKERMTTCGDCDCLSGYRTCTEWVFENGRWVPSVVFLDSCGLLGRFIGCFNRVFGRR